MTMIEKNDPLLIRDPGRRLSAVLKDLDVQEGERVSVGDIVSALRDRSFAPLMVIFAAPNVFLFIPGSSVFTALPLMLLAVQLVLGRSEVWLPGFVSERSIERAAFRRVVSVSIPYIERFEKLAKPRWWPTSYLLAERAIGVATLILALFLFLPIPFANGLPALSIIFLAMGLGERDGYWLAGGMLLTLVSTVFVAGMISVGAFAVLEFLFK